MHVVVNAATSADGKLSSRRREQIRISGPEDFDRVDRVRAESDAVMVGIGTVLADDPSLTVDEGKRLQRDESGQRVQPIRVVADSRARTPLDARLLDDDAPTYLLASEAAPSDRIAALEDHGVTTVIAGAERTDLAGALDALEAAGIERLMIEGGGELIYSLFAADLVDELSVFVGSTIIGGRDAPTLADGDGFIEEFPSLQLDAVERIDDGVLLSWSVTAE